MRVAVASGLAITAAAQGTRMVIVTFEINGATGGTAPSPQTVTHGTNITLPGQPGFGKVGHSLDSWNTRADGTGNKYTAGSPFTVTDNVTLFAIWAVPTEITITVTEISGVCGSGDGDTFILLICPGSVHTVTWTWSGSSVTGGSVTFSLLAIPGIFDIRLWFESPVPDGDCDRREQLYILSSKSLVAHTSIPLSAFTIGLVRQPG